ALTKRAKAAKARGDETKQKILGSWREVARALAKQAKARGSEQGRFAKRDLHRSASM
ncbi:hypothetical protein A2U01_0056428, partial [Trifolium medium]|nr:hypothetical protein [Trifolium medium]